MKLFKMIWYRTSRKRVDRAKQIPEGSEYLELISGGTVDYRMDGCRQKAGRGALFWHLPGDSTLARKASDPHYQCFVFWFKGCGGARRHTPHLVHLENPEEVLAFAYEMLTALHIEQFDNAILCDYAYSRLRWHAHHARLQQEQSPNCPHLQPLLDDIEAHPGRNLSVADMSRRCGVSASRLHTLFRTQLKTTPQQYVQERRLRYARHLLVSTDKPIKEISSLCEFDHLETFYRSFKKRFELSPMAFKRSHFLQES